MEPADPSDVLPEGVDHLCVAGVTARKGSVAAFVTNARTFCGLADDDPDRPALLAELRASVPTLRAIGVLDVFELRSPELRAVLETP